MVLLHGYCDSADTWRGVLDELATAYQPEVVRHPLLVIAGGNDPLVRPEGGRKLHGRVRRSSLLVRDE